MRESTKRKSKTEHKELPDEEELKNALYKKALGFDSTETVEEYVSDEEGIKLSKKKVTTKVVPPDISAIKMLLVDEVQNIETMTDEELEKEKQRLIGTLIKEKQKGEQN